MENGIAYALRVTLDHYPFLKYGQERGIIVVVFRLKKMLGMLTPERKLIPALLLCVWLCLL